MLGNLKVFLAILVFGLIERVWFCMRLSYLRTRQKKVNLDFSKEVALGYAFWSYSVQAILFIFCIIALTQFFSTQNHAIAKYMYLAMFVFMLILAFGSLVPRLKTSVNIGVGKQISYITFSRQRTIHADQIISYTCNTYFYYVTKKDGKITKIPATLKNSEIVMAFLENAVAKHSAK